MLSRVINMFQTGYIFQHIIHIKDLAVPLQGFQGLSGAFTRTLRSYQLLYTDLAVPLQGLSSAITRTDYCRCKDLAVQTTRKHVIQHVINILQTGYMLPHVIKIKYSAVPLHGLQGLGSAISSAFPTRHRPGITGAWQALPGPCP